MLVYKIKQAGIKGPTCYCITQQELEDIIKEDFEGDASQAVVEQVEMSQEDYDALDEFEGW